MPLDIATTDYTDMDYTAIKADLETQLGITLPTYTDRSRAGFGNAFIGMYAYILDKLGHYLNRFAGEGHWGLLKRRRSLLSLGKLILFVPESAKASFTTETFTLGATTGDNTSFPLGTVVKTPDGVEYETQVVLNIPAGMTVGNVLVENSVAHSDPFVGTGAADQAFTLLFIPFVGGSAVVTVDAVTWTLVTSFFHSTSTDLHYRLVVDEEDRPTIIFGNGTNGKAPPVSSVIAVAYKTGGGVDGDVAAGKIIVIQGAFSDDSGAAVTVTVTNASKSTGGEDAESLEAARERGPLTNRQVGERTCANDDYVANGEKVAGVERILALGRQEDPALLANQADLVIVPTGIGVPSAALKTAVKTQVTVTFPNTIGIQVLTSDPSYVTIAVTVDVFLKAGAVEADVTAAINAALTALFAPKNADGTKNTDVDFGSVITEMPYSLIFCTIAKVAGIRKLDEDTFVPADDTALTLRQWPKLGTVTVNYP